MKKETIEKLNEIQKSNDNKLKSRMYFTEQPFLGLGPEYIHIVITSVRGVGKSVLSMGYVMALRKKYGAKNVKCFFFRLSDMSVKALLADNASKLVDPVTRDKYGCEITRKGNIVYDHGVKLCEVYALCGAAKNKGLAVFDYAWINQAPIDKRTGKPIKRFIILMTDEFEADAALEKQSIATRNTAGLLKNYMETILRNQKQPDYPAVRCFYLANKVSEASNFLFQMWNFAPPPDKFGVFKNKKKGFYMVNPKPTKEYIEDRKKSIMGTVTDYENDANYTNQLMVDKTLIKPKNVRLIKPTRLIKFDDNPSNWFVVYDGIWIRTYRREKIKDDLVLYMTRHKNGIYIPEVVEQFFVSYDCGQYKYCDWKTLSCFRGKMREIKK